MEPSKTNSWGLVHDVNLSMGRPSQAQNTLGYQGKASKRDEIRVGSQWFSELEKEGYCQQEGVVKVFAELRCTGCFCIVQRLHGASHSLPSSLTFVYNRGSIGNARKKATCSPRTKTPLYTRNPLLVEVDTMSL